ncbi:hypothetical protein NEOLEDRAFT_1129500, partial [Neolentinus lepideus HHB14362 ss-1]
MMISDSSDSTVRVLGPRLRLDLILGPEIPAETTPTIDPSRLLTQRQYQLMQVTLWDNLERLQRQRETAEQRFREREAKRTAKRVAGHAEARIFHVGADAAPTIERDVTMGEGEALGSKGEASGSKGGPVRAEKTTKTARKSATNKALGGGV